MPRVSLLSPFPSASCGDLARCCLDGSRPSLSSSALGPRTRPAGRCYMSAPPCCMLHYALDLYLLAQPCVVLSEAGLLPVRRHPH